MSDLLTTKLRRPAIPPQRIQRPHLIQRINDGLRSGRRIVLVSAPPGFGKTTLLGEWATQVQSPVAWLSLDESDNDPLRFWSYLIAACQSLQAEIGETARALLHTPETLPPDALPTTLLNDLAQFQTERVLILDDYHVIQNETIQAAILFLIEHLPDHLRLILATRIDPPWPLARLRARQQLLELRALDLRFTPEEAAAFLNQQLALKLSLENVAALEARTEGWIAGLQLAALAMQTPFSLTGRRDPDGFIAAFAGSHVYVAEYLIEEVLQHQPAEIQTFLLQTSLLERLNGALCEVVTGYPAGQNMLRQLYQANIFILSLDDEGQWFRYHRLFADLLQARLQQSVSREAIAALHGRASRWYEAAGLLNEAIQHASAAADTATVIRLIESHAVEMLMQGYASTVEHWLAAIPPEERFQSPRINLAFAWMHLLRGAFSSAVPYVERLHTLLADAQLNAAPPSLKAEWLALQAYLLSAQGRLTQSLELAQQARDLAPKTDDYVQSLAYNALGSTYLMLNDYPRVVEVYQKTIQLGRAAAHSLVEMMGISVLTQIATQHGQLHFAYQIAAQGIERIEQSGSPPALVAAVHGALGQIQYQWGNLAEARRHLLRTIQLCALSGYVAGEIYGRASLSRLLQREGNWSAAEQEMQKTTALLQLGLPMWGGDEAVSQQVRLLLAQQQPDLAENALFSFQAGLSSLVLEPAQAITYSIGLLYNSVLRILLYRVQLQPDRERLSQGIELADRLVKGALQNQYLVTALETLTLRAQLHAALGENEASLADVAQALKLAEPEEFINLFVEAGERMKSLIEDSRAVLDKQSDRLNYIDRLLAAFPAVTPQTRLPQSEISNLKSEILVEPLTPRELEVLCLIAAGDTNQMIADKLVVTVRAVKKHTGNIYGKLNVSSRTQAVARARQLGLLPSA